MGKSFFLGDDAQLLTGSQAFSDQISASPATFGLTVGAAADYAALNTTYATSYQVAKAPETRTKGTVAAKNTARANLKASAALLASIIQGQSNVSDQQKIDLGISVRATPTPVGPPGTATDFSATLDGNGALNLKWKCHNPKGSRGTFYNVWRKLDAGEFQFCGVAGSKQFVDNTVPNGTGVVTYQIQAGRTTAAGPWATFVVTFGTGGGAVAVEQQTPKLAA